MRWPRSDPKKAAISVTALGSSARFGHQGRIEGLSQGGHIIDARNLGLPPCPAPRRKHVGLKRLAVRDPFLAQDLKQSVHRDLPEIFRSRGCRRCLGGGLGQDGLCQGQTGDKGKAHQNHGRTLCWRVREVIASPALAKPDNPQLPVICTIAMANFLRIAPAH